MMHLSRRTEGSEILWVRNHFGDALARFAIGFLILGAVLVPGILWRRDILWNGAWLLPVGVLFGVLGVFRLGRREAIRFRPGTHMGILELKRLRSSSHLAGTIERVTVVPVARNEVRLLVHGFERPIEMAHGPRDKVIAAAKQMAQDFSVPLS